MGKVRCFTLEERKEIEKLLKQGESLPEISRKIGRSKSGLVYETRRCGNKDDYTAEEAHRVARSTLVEKYSILSERNAGQYYGIKYKQRIENLEMQIEILHDCIKEILSDRENKRI